MNTNVITVPSIVGISDCINETLSVDVEAVPTAGGGKWQNYKARNIRAMVTGEAYLTPDNEGQLRAGSEVVVKQLWLKGIVTENADTADATGRAIKKYEVITTRPAIPYPEDLICLYVPKWQDEHGQTLHDFSGNGFDLTRESGGALKWGDDYLQKTYTTVLANARVTISNLFDYTILSRREVDSVHRSNAMGFKLRQGNSSVVYTECRRTQGRWECGSLSGGAVYVNLVDDDWTYQRTSDYNGTAIKHGTRAVNTTIISMGAGYGTSHGSWIKVWCLMMWRRQLTEREIAAAQRYIEATPTAADFTH